MFRPPRLSSLTNNTLTLFTFLTFLTLSILLTLTVASPINTNTDNLKHDPKRLDGPVIASDFPDPSIILVDGTWYAFGTQSVFDRKHIRVQVATSEDFDRWELWEGDAMGTLPPWVDAQNPQIWAPDILRREDGTFILFFSATTRSNPRLHCVGTAISDNIKGPYHSNSDVPFACPLAQGGAIDASAFRDDDGTRYVLYKIDGNALGHGGSCGNTVEPLVSTPIMIQCVDADWTTPIGDPVQILDRDEIDGPLVEAPTMIKRDGTYYLFFSSNCYITSLYDTSYATSTSPTGKFTKAAFPLLISGTVKETAGPGHADVDFDGVHIAFHAYATLGDVGARRALFVKKLDVGNEVVKLRSPAPPAGG